MQSDGFSGDIFAKRLSSEEEEDNSEENLRQMIGDDAVSRLHVPCVTKQSPPQSPGSRILDTEGSYMPEKRHSSPRKTLANEIKRVKQV